jgi:hypothetical protein
MVISCQNKYKENNRWDKKNGNKIKEVGILVDYKLGKEGDTQFNEWIK